MREGEGAVPHVGGEGGGSESEGGEAVSVSVSSASCRPQSGSSSPQREQPRRLCLFSFSFPPGARHLEVPFIAVLFLARRVCIFVARGSRMPVVGVASKLRQPSAVSPRPVHTALPIPSAVRAATSQGCGARQQEVRPGQGVPGLSCQLKPEYQQERTAGGRTRADTEESKICKVSGCCRCQL